MIKKLFFLSIIFCSTIGAQWIPIENAGTPPIVKDLDRLQLLKLSVGSQDNIWSLWIGSKKTVQSYPYVVALWANNQWNPIDQKFLKRIKEINDISAPATGGVYILGNFDAGKLTNIVNDIRAELLSDKEMSKVDVKRRLKNEGALFQTALEKLISGKENAHQSLYFWDGTMLRTQSIRNTLTYKIDADTVDNVILRSAIRTFNHQLNGKTVSQWPNDPQTEIEAIYAAQSTPQATYKEIEISDGESRQWQIKSNDTAILEATNKPLNYWHVENNNLWYVFNNGQQDIIKQKDLATNNEKSILPVPSGLYKGRSLYSQTPISIGTDGTVWALGTNGIMYQWIP